MKKISLIFLLTSIVILNSCDGFKWRSESSKPVESNKKTTFNKEGDSVSNVFRKDGSLKSSITIKNGERNGPSFVYYENGNVQFEINYTNSYKDSIVKYYYESGKIYRTTMYDNGLKDGIQKYYHENGKLKAEVPYKDNEVVPSTKEYSKSGTLIGDYPKLVVIPVDNLAFKNEYELKISLKPKMKKASFYISKKFGDGYAKIRLSDRTKDGVATQVYNVYPGQSLMEKVKIRAETKSKRGIPIVLTRTYNLVVDNRNY